MNFLPISIFTIIFVEFLTYPIYIKYAKKRSLGQYIREEGPDLHGYKEGTPTAGGIIFILGIFLISLIHYFQTKNSIFLVLCISAILFGSIGLLDDLLSIYRKNALGLKAYQKFLLQILASAVILLVIQKFNPHNFIEIPFLKYQYHFSYFFYYLFALLVITGTSNAVNLTDGLDGLAGGVFLFTVLMLSLLEKDVRIFVILGIPLIPFLYFNVKPAKIFMGDTGSIALGGILGSYFVFYGKELYLLFLGFVFFIEALSVIIQVASYKMRKKRVFLMSPIHHHFELKGWREETIVFRFILLNILAGAVLFILG